MGYNSSLKDLTSSSTSALWGEETMLSSCSTSSRMEGGGGMFTKLYLTTRKENKSFLSQLFMVVNLKI